MCAQAPHSKSLIGALNSMSISVQPDVFFNFSGSAGAVSRKRTIF